MQFLLLGGFLGAGKTTTIARLARTFQERGQRVGVVTNDQADHLVDTTALQAQGLAVAEVPGACFCCRFEELVSQVGSLSAPARPDVILAEPVGSCTDLVATVIQPLRALYGAQFRVGPYAVLFKPSHGRRILRNEPGAGFSPKAAYIFRKQLEEADALVMNRADELTAEQQAELLALLRHHYPDKPVLTVSARTGQGFADLLALFAQTGPFGRHILTIDYDIYAAGEAELGWLNLTAHLNAAAPFALDGLLVEVLEQLTAPLIAAGAEVAHVKVIGLSDGQFGVANRVSSTTPVELSLPSTATVTRAELIVNARVATDPESLADWARAAVQTAADARAARTIWGASQSLRPGRPMPTHRYVVANA
jgi:Ni2+-binding GTPase involved in maturation of urease and hydrogenase